MNSELKEMILFFGGMIFLVVLVLAFILGFIFIADENKLKECNRWAEFVEQHEDAEYTEYIEDRCGLTNNI